MPPRPDILDRDGVPIAVTLPSLSVYVNPAQLFEPRAAVAKLCALFPDLQAAVLHQKIRSNKKFIWIQRHIGPEMHQKLLLAGIPGVHVQQQQRRVYPYGALFAHILGFTDVDGQGISGMEKTLNGASSTPVRLSISSKLQHILRTALLQTMADFSAPRANGILLNVRTGEVLAMVSLPDFDPHHPGAATPQQLFNANLSGVYEFGSIMKIHNLALALEKNVAHLHTVYDASVPMRVGRFSIKDFRGKNAPMTVSEGFLRSSNIVNAQMARQAGPAQQKAFLAQLGLLRSPKTELVEKAAPLIPHQWTEVTAMTVGYGYGLGTSPIAMAQSLAALVSGFLRPITFLHQNKHVQGQRVVSPKTVDALCDLMRENILDGQAKRAEIEGYALGGKTGTANMRIAGHYKEKNNLTSFVGIYPCTEPKYLLLISIEKPQANAKTHGFATAGWIAAPVAGQILQKSLFLLGVPLDSVTPDAYAALPSARPLDSLIQEASLHR
jgi:cell division protein FtsI (penicillin-binding protein 3)